MLSLPQRRWQRCDKQQAAVFYFPIFHFVVVVAVVPVVAANPRKNYILTFVRGEKGGGGQCKTQATRG